MRLNVDLAPLVAQQDYKSSGLEGDGPQQDIVSRQYFITF